MSYLQTSLYYIYAEYNPVWCYMGWWLYAAPIVKESKFPKGEYECPVISRCDYPDHDNAVWLNNDWELDVLMKCLGLRELHDYRCQSHKYTADFLKKFPTGALCNYDGQYRTFTLAQDSDDLWEYSKIMKEWQMLKWAKSSGDTQEKLEVLERELRKISV